MPRLSKAKIGFLGTHCTVWSSYEYSDHSLRFSLGNWEQWLNLFRKAFSSFRSKNMCTFSACAMSSLDFTCGYYFRQTSHLITFETLTQLKLLQGSVLNIFWKIRVKSKAVEYWNLLVSILSVASLCCNDHTEYFTEYMSGQANFFFVFIVQ